LEFDLIWVGFLKKTYGRKGGLKVELHESIIDRIEPGTFLFIDLDGDHVPFEISTLEFKSDAIIYFEDISNPEQASQFTGRQLYIEKRHLDTNLIGALSDDDLEYGFLSGYKLLHPEIGEIGIIEAVEMFPQQEMAVIKKSRDHKILIPLIPDLIEEIIEKKKLVTINFPVDILKL